jgi:hypothetical protein
MYMDGSHVTRLTPRGISLRLLRALRLRAFDRKGAKKSRKERKENETILLRIAGRAIIFNGGSILQAWISENTFASPVER